MPSVPTADDHLLHLLTALQARGYAFVTPTPATHARVVARAERREARTVEDMLGWSLPYRPGQCDPAIEAILEQAGVVVSTGASHRATIRVSCLHDRLFVHSAYPTDAPDAVFFGPDSYRFAALLDDALRAAPLRPDARMVDIGTGSGVGGIVAALAWPDLRVHVTDVNPAALRFARINARAAGVSIVTHEAATLDPVPDAIDLATANPPFIIDRERRLYRDGGAMHGGQVSFDMAAMAVPRLAPGGRLILYTGSAIVRGGDALRAALTGLAHGHGCAIRYREIDPDVFGEELDAPAYRDVDRIALVAAIVTRPTRTGDG
ncbi:class I SAM-dependent methyltransferase [Sphingomonas sp. A2-49]|uniref:class I SAM-dependent methyltransferase n=1 Tax=Sphingomonas sp. A2-49 TaxID=1391375 RepID=UPI0021CF11DE|nr:class I SAM-dependent methyltransferase [Sphingomonas sp. A2-49]MCU6453755.1 class I SAM-dependent methyltransferase [Sphingomonas sp. A2-49]